VGASSLILNTFLTPACSFRFLMAFLFAGIRITLYLQEHALLSCAASIKCMKLHYWHTFAKCCFIMHCIARNANIINWHMFLVSSLYGTYSEP
jgi:hypothetical protein